MAKRIVCYGDSNTYGYDAADVLGGRLPPEKRWPEILSGLLGYAVTNCGMNGRMVPRSPRMLEADLHLIRRHAPFDLVIVMLGTNDLLTDHDPEKTAESMESFLHRLRKGFPGTGSLIAAPPAATGFEIAFLELRDLYAQLADRLQIGFADTTAWEIEMSHDDVHFSPEGNTQFARRMAQILR